MADQVNNAGGLLGRKIEYLAEDDQTNAEAGQRAARKLIDVDKTQAIMSVWASAVGTAVLPQCWENRVMMLAISAADSLALLPHRLSVARHIDFEAGLPCDFGREFGRKAVRIVQLESEFA